MTAFTEQDKDILVKIVKIAQGRNVKGSEGEWLDFVKKRLQIKNITVDPAKYPWKTLADFVGTFTDKKDIKIATRLKKWKKHRQKLANIENFLGSSPAQELVRLTYQYPKFNRLYSFPSYHEGWLVTKLGKPEIEDKIISIDCEMVLCRDGTQEVVQVCAVDQNLATVLNTLVKPSKPVVDYLTHITGIKAADLEDVECTLKDVQEKLKKLLTPNTIVVGHSLYHDLKVLQVDHARVIDTALIFDIKNRPPGYTPSLVTLCKAVLGWDFREEGKPHVCLDDAIVPMKLVLAKIEHGLNNPLTIIFPENGGPNLAKLFIHRIPHEITSDDIHKLFSNHSVRIKDFSNTQKKFKCTSAIFESVDIASDAFENLGGEVVKDEQGCTQKVVTLRKLKSGAILTCMVRKMSAAEEASANLVTVNGKRPREVGADISSADVGRLHKQERKKIDTDIPSAIQEAQWAKNPCLCIHFIENERLRKELEEKDAEIRQLQTIVKALERMHGL
eukprot:TRINITY_DN17016_c0_g1_i1.p1 TRINITY_DN17016_c0_g1~~TRINITY_DN17016_c0_g1_i1.p1  ORF type:complete len:502 (-),score=92.44 TRINITY_DN17016_c0_g1_i1:196-1701(-)